MKRFVLVVTLACALSGTALAGEIHTTGAPEPAPTAQSSGVLATVILTVLSLVR